MFRSNDTMPLTKPTAYLVRMVVFLVLGAFIAFILYRQIIQAFNANPSLNALIFGVLIVGMVLAFRSVTRLYREIEWANAFLESDSGIVIEREPVLLLPMARMLAGRSKREALSPLSLRAILDTIGMRLDETRDTGRYLTGLLVFLGLLGTFWGLLDTVGSVGKVIQSMKTGSDAALMFEELKAGLTAPLGGMGISFSSSLFGLAGSLVVGFLDLQAGQSQNQFYEQLENFLASVAGPEATIGEPAVATSAGLPEPSLAAANVAAIENLAAGIQSLVTNMRAEQQLIRDWVEAQAAREAEIKSVLSALHKAIDGKG
ncbi:MAG: flagellar motor protein MotA [Alphaproteobacteria bacterium]|nr:flagellar motor protein MotA [Alphaproteobacteria bacterium]